MAFAAAAEDAMDEESDTELFSVSIPGPSVDNPNDRNLSASPIYSSQHIQNTLELSSPLDSPCTNVLDLREGTNKSAEKISKQGMIH
jgi:hypothetical protein